MTPKAFIALAGLISPMATYKVVQGVQRRSEDAEGPEKVSGEEFRAPLPKPPPDESAPAQSG